MSSGFPITSWIANNPSSESYEISCNSIKTNLTDVKNLQIVDNSKTGHVFKDSIANERYGSFQNKDSTHELSSGSLKSLSSNEKFNTCTFNNIAQYGNHQDNNNIRNVKSNNYCKTAESQEIKQTHLSSLDFTNFGGPKQISESYNLLRNYDAEAEFKARLLNYTPGPFNLLGGEIVSSDNYFQAYLKNQEINNNEISFQINSTPRINSDRRGKL